MIGEIGPQSALSGPAKQLGDLLVVIESSRTPRPREFGRLPRPVQAWLVERPRSGVLGLPDAVRGEECRHLWCGRGLRHRGRGLLPAVGARHRARAGGRGIAGPPAARRHRADRHALGVVAADERAPARSPPRLPGWLRLGSRRGARRARSRRRGVVVRGVRTRHAHGDVRAGPGGMSTGGDDGGPRRGDDRQPGRDADRRRRRPDRRPARRRCCRRPTRRVGRCSPGWCGRRGRTNRSDGCGGRASCCGSIAATATSRRASPTAWTRSR